METATLTFEPETHTYRLRGEAIPSVTQLTAIYGADMVEPDGDMELTLEAAAERGTALHGYIEYLLRGGEGCEYEMPDMWRGYADAVELFLSEHTLDPMLVETAMYAHENDVDFAGRPDFVGEFDGVLSILDWKFVSQVQKTKVWAQLNGYLSLCYHNDVFPDELYCVQFLSDGTYRLYPASSLAFPFDLCLNVWREKNRKHQRGRIG